MHSGGEWAMRRIFLTTCLLSLPACATLSFAPPQVRMDKEISANNGQTFFNAACTPNDKRRAPTIKPNVDGAIRLINNFVLTYRCQADRAAEGRQFFEVPSMLATIGGATAAAFGAAPGVAIGTGAFSATMGQGKSYYAPKDKAVVLNDGMDALLCIQNEAVGVDPFTLKTLAAAQENSGSPPPKTTDEGKGNTREITLLGVGEQAPSHEPEVSVSYGQQYFVMVRSALFSVERVVAQRLSAAGTPFDASGVVAEIEQLNKKAADEKDATEGKDAKSATEAAQKEGAAAKKLAPPTASASSGFTLLESKQRRDAFDEADRGLQQLDAEQLGRAIIKLRTLQTKLEKCIVRAKV
jgi:hypothetical protein